MTRRPRRMSAKALTPTLAVALTFASPPTLTVAQGVKPVPYKYEENCECAAPGITLRWKAAYCMSLVETDDLENEGAQRCLARPDPGAVRKLGACAQNAHWKTMICGVVHDKKDVPQCVRDKTFVPRFVERGPGSPAALSALLGTCRSSCRCVRDLIRGLACRSRTTCG